MMLKKEYMVQENVADIEREMRVSMPNAYEYYKEKYEIDDDFIIKFNDFRILHENANALPYINAHMVCKFAYQHGIANYLYTHRDKSADSMLQKHGFREMFTEVVTFENSFPRKPAPDGLNYLIKKYNMNKDEVLAVGDREIDLLSAKAVGIKFCLFSPKLKHDIQGTPDFTVQNFSDLYYIIEGFVPKSND